MKVHDLDNGRDVTVRINDRGPFVAGRIIDLSYAAAQAMGMNGIARVQLEILGANPDLAAVQAVAGAASAGPVALTNRESSPCRLEPLAIPPMPIALRP